MKIPLIGGPLCGEYVILQENIPNSVRLHSDKKLYLYELYLDRSEEYTFLRYEFTNEIE